VLRRTYGKDNQVLHTAKLSQGFKVVAPSRTWQGAGISSGGTKIGVTGGETRSETEIEQGFLATHLLELKYQRESACVSIPVFTRAHSEIPQIYATPMLVLGQ
jgi:hypothetical protein